MIRVLVSLAKRPLVWVLLTICSVLCYKCTSGLGSMKDRFVENMDRAKTVRAPSSSPVQQAENVQAPRIPSVDKSRDVLVRPQLGPSSRSEALRANLSSVTREPSEVESVLRYRFKNRKVLSAESLASLGDGNRVMVDDATNSVIISGLSSSLTKAIQELDTPSESLTIEAVIAYAALDDASLFSLDWLVRGVNGTFLPLSSGGRSGYSVGLGNESMQLALTHQQTKGRVSIVSRPSVVMMSGEKGLLESGREVAVPVTSQNLANTRTSVEFKEVLLSLSVSPILFADGSVFVSVVQTNNSVGNVRLIDGNEIPELAVQRLTTSARVSLGMWFCAGSVRLLEVSDAESAQPWLARLPVLGRVFTSSSKSRQRVETGIFLRVLRSLDYSPYTERSVSEITVPGVYNDRPIVRPKMVDSRR